MPGPDSLSSTLREAHQAEQAANAIAEMIEWERRSAQTTVRELIHRRDPLVQVFARASQRLLETTRRREALAPETEVWGRISYL